MKSENKSLLCAIVVSYIVFMTGWYLRETYIDFSYLNPYLEACINFVIYGLWWSGFAFLLLQYFGKKLNWDLKEILTKRPHGKILLIAIPTILIYYFICWAVAGFQFSFGMNWLDYLLTVAYICEWMKHSVKGILSYFAIFLVIFIVVWIVQYLIWKIHISKIKEGIQKNK